MHDALPPSPTPPALHATRGLARAVRTVAGMTLLSRLGGLIRDVLVVRIFGATAVGSAFAAAFAIPNMFRRLFGEGALSAAFIPEYAQAHKTDPALAGRLASLTVGLLAAATVLLTLVVELALFLVLLFAPGNPNRVLSLQLIMLMLPFMPAICTAAILGGILQVHGRFGPASSGPLLLNAFIIAAGLWYLITNQQGGPGAAFLIGTAAVLSGFTQAAWFFFLLRRDVRWTRAVADARPAARRMVRRFVPVLIGLGTLQISALLDTVIAMWPVWVGPTILGRPYPLDDASNIILTATQRLYQFPLGVFGIAVATAVFPLLSRHADAPAEFADTLRRGLRLSLFIGLPASLGLIAVRHDLTAVIYSGGGSGFQSPALARAAAVLLGYAPAVWAYSLNHVFTRAFYAKGDTATPMKVAIGAVALNLLLNLILIWPLREAGLAWSTSIAATAQCAALAFLSRRFLSGALPRPAGDPGLRSPFARIAFASLVMALAVVAVQAMLTPAAPAGWSGHLLMLAVACSTGAASYLAAAVLLKLPELRWLLGRAA